MKKKTDPTKKKKPYSYSRNSKQGTKDLPKKTDGTGFKEAFYGRKNKAKKKPVKKSTAKAEYHAKKKKRG